MTLNEYINNPYGTNSISAQARESMKASYVDKLDKVYLRENGKEFKKAMFKDKSSWYLYLQVPSETIPDFTYDVVIQFIEPDKCKTLYDCEVRFFSNDPAFMYSAYVYDKNKLLINDLKPKLPLQSITIKSEKNPKNVPGYIKSIYFAILMCKRYGFTNKVLFESNARKYNKMELSSLVEHASDKLRDRQSAEEQYKIEKKNKEKTISTKEIENPTNKKVQDKVAKTISMTKTSRVIDKKSSVKQTKQVSRISRRSK